MPRLLFTSLRAGLEATPGTLVPPTRFLEFTTLDPTQTVQTIRPKTYRRSRFGYYSAAAGREENAVKFGGNLTFNQAAWLGNVFIKDVGTGTGAGADKTYDFTPTSASDDIKRASIEYGFEGTPTASQPAFQVAGMVGSELTLSFDKENQDGATFDATLMSHKAATQISAYTGSPSSIDSTPVSPNTVTVYVDAGGGTIGTTQDDNFTKADWKLTNKFSKLFTLDGGTAAKDMPMSDVHDWELSTVRYYEDKNEHDRYVDKAERLIRVESIGPALGGSNFTITLDLYGVLDTATWTETNGLWMEQLTYKNLYDTVAATDYALSVVTAEATIS